MMKFSKITLFALLFFAFAGNGMAQNAPQYIWEKTPYPGYGTSIDYQNGALFCTGNIMMGTADMLLVKLDTAGTEIWNKSLALSTGMLVGNGIVAHSAGITVSGIYTPSSMASSQDFVGFFDANGDSIAIHKYAHSQQPNFEQRGGQLQPRTQGGYVIAGNHLFTIDANGNETWSKAIAANDVATTQDGGFVVCGTRLVGPTSIMYIWKFDANGDSLWYHDVASIIGGVCNATGIYEEPNSGDIYLTGFGYELSTANDANVLLVKFSSTGTQQWWNWFTGAGYDEATSIHGGPSGELILTTTKQDPVSGKLIALLGIDQNGNEIYKHIYGDYGIQNFVDLDQAGTALWMIGTFQGIIPQVVLRKLDMSPTVGIDDRLEFVPFALYPNPAIDQFTIETQDSRSFTYKIYNLSGQAIQQGHFAETATKPIISTKGMPAGMYIFQYNDLLGKSYAKRFIVADK